jgi:DNA (cytosine-5)-methyltransferase 1
LSLAGDGRGLGEAGSEIKTRSGTFWPFWGLMEGLKSQNRAPKLIVLENVFGALTSRGGQDFSAICSALADADYRFGAMVVDAKHFVPQSRQRVFFVAAATGLDISPDLTTAVPAPQWHPPALMNACAGLPARAQENWLWWNLKMPVGRNTVFSDIIEDNPAGVRWHAPSETKRILDLMSPVHRSKVDAAMLSDRKMVGGVYRRTRPEADGARRQRAEVRFDEISGCLRTPRGGSSRQTILVVEGQSIRSRLLSPREAARLMGLDDDYKLPSRYNDAYHVAGDGVCVPVVRHIAANLLEPILAANGFDRDRIAA